MAEVLRAPISDVSIAAIWFVDIADTWALFKAPTCEDVNPAIWLELSEVIAVVDSAPIPLG